jgi:hypothetical protein
MPEFKFKSGQVVYIEPIIHSQPASFTNGDKQAAIEIGKRQRQACKHIGSNISVVSTSCGGVPRDGVWECALHGKCAPLVRVSLDARPCATCPDYEAAPDPGLIRLGLNLLTAIGKWTKAGKPVRSQQRVNELLAICKVCPYMSTAKGGATYCGKCGCPINDGMDAMKNKLAMATEACPLNPPLWIAESLPTPAPSKRQVAK